MRTWELLLLFSSDMEMFGLSDNLYTLPIIKHQKMLTRKGKQTIL